MECDAVVKKRRRNKKKKKHAVQKESTNTSPTSCSVSATQSSNIQHHGTTKLPYEPKVYQLAAGTIVNNGFDYKIKIIALFSLHCLGNNSEKMWLASNPKGIHGFDHIVWYRQLADGATVTLLMQLKHRDNEKNLTEVDFLKNGFHLVNYLKCFSKLVKELHNFENNSEIIKHLRDVKNIKFVLFTNSAAEDFRFLEKCVDTDLGFVDTSGLGMIHRFKYDELLKCTMFEQNLEFRKYLNNKDFSQILDRNPGKTSKKIAKNNICLESEQILKSDAGNKMHRFNKLFFDHLSLFSNQVHIRDVNSLLKAKTEQLLGLHEISSLDFENILDKYVSFIKSWARGKVGGNYPLTNIHIKKTLTSICLDNYLVKFATFNYSHANTLNIGTWDEITSDISVTIINPEEKVYQFLNTFISHKVCQQLAKCKFSNTVLWDDKQFSLQSRELSKKMRSFITESSKITLLNIYKFLWTEKLLPLVVEANTFQDYENILKILKVINYSLSVVIVNKTGKKLSKLDHPVKYFVRLEDLNDSCKDKLAFTTIKLQGRQSTTFHDFLVPRIVKYITPNDVINILFGDFSVGNILQPVPFYFIHRKLLRTYLKPEVLEEVTTDLFVIRKKPEDEIGALNIKNLEICYLDKMVTRNINGCNIVITEEENYSLKEILKLTAFNVVHDLQYHHTGKLEWKRSLGSIKNIQPYQLENVEISESIATVEKGQYYNYTSILSDVPGMGKSMLMEFLAQEAPAGVWVLKIDLNRYFKYYKSNACQNRTTTAQEHLCFFNNDIQKQHQCDTDLAKEIFLKLLEKKRVLVLLDGFDEVSNFYKDQVLSITKAVVKEGHPVWITTRPHMRLHLEEELNCLTISLAPLSTSEQKQFLRKYFSRHTLQLDPHSQKRLEMFIDELLEAAKTNLNDRDADFTGIPLQMKLLAEAFDNDCISELTEGSFNKKFDLLYLYQHFVETKIEILCDKLGESAVDTHNMFEELHSLLALKLLFPCKQFTALCQSVYDSFFKFLPKNIQPLQRSGILMLDDEFNVQFVHRTYAEYLSGHWLSKHWNNEKSKERRKAAEMALKQRFDWNYNFTFNVFDRIIAQDNPFHLAIINGQLDRVEAMMDCSPEVVHSEDKLKRSPLHIAAIYVLYQPSHTYQRHLIHLNSEKSAVQGLIARMLSYDDNICEKCDHLGYNSLDYALASGCFSVAEQMCSAKSIAITSINIDTYSLSLDLKDKYFFYCGMLGYKALFNTLLRYFAFYDLLHSYIKFDHDVLSYCTECCDRLVTEHNDLVRKTITTYLNELGVSQLSDLFRLRSIDPNSSNGDYYINIHLAAAFGSKYNLDMLINAGDDINKHDAFLRTPLHYAVVYQSSEIVKMLHLRGACIYDQYYQTYSTLHNPRTSGFNNLEASATIQIMKQQFYIKPYDTFVAHIEKIVELDDVKLEGDVHVVTVDSNALDVLISYLNAALSQKQFSTRHTEKTIYDIIQEDDPLVLQSILSTVLDVNIQNHEGDTALHCAARRGSLKIVQVLLSYSVEEAEPFLSKNELARPCIQSSGKILEINKQNSKKQTALHIAIEARHMDVVKLLLQHGADVNIGNKSGHTAVHQAVKTGAINILALIIEQGAKLDGQDFQNNTALQLAIGTGQIHAAKLLHANGADPNLLGFEGNGILHHAAISGCRDSISWALSLGADIDEKNAHKVTPLHVAVKKGDVEAAKILYSHGADVNAIGPNGNTTLHYATGSDIYRMVAWVLSFKPVVKVQNSQGTTPLHVAVSRGHKDIANLLKLNGADFKILDCKSNSILHYAVESRSQETIMWVLALGIEIDQRNCENDTPLHVAFKKGNIGASKLLIGFGADVTVLGFNGSSILHYAASSGSEETIAWILRTFNIDINLQNQESETSLHIAVRNSHVEVAKTLLLFGADINLLGSIGRTLVHYATASGSLETLSWILSLGIDINKQNEKHNTALHNAILMSNLQAAKMLYLHGADIAIPSLSGNTVLHRAAESGTNDIISWLLFLGVGINTRNKRNEVPLHTAIERGNHQAAKLLLDHGSDINALGFQGDAALHYAARSGSEEIISWVLSLGAAVDQRNLQNETPLHTALRKGNTNAVKYLHKCGADVRLLGFCGSTILHCATQSGSQETVSWALKFAKAVNEPNEKNNTPLHIAAKLGHATIAKMLRSLGADVNVVGSGGNTPLHDAAENGSSDTIALLLRSGADSNIKNSNNDTPLHISLKKGHVSATTLLILQISTKATENNN